MPPNGGKGEVRFRRADLALGFGVMMIRKRQAHPARQFQVVVCFGCGALIGRTDRNFVSIFWNDGDPLQDEVVTPNRACTVRMCRACRLELVERAGLTIVMNKLVVNLVLDTTNEMSKTGGHEIAPTRGMRKAV